MEQENLIPHHGVVHFYGDFFTPEEATALSRQLMESVPWKQEPIRMFGKLVMQPRLTSWFSDAGVSYSYSGIKMESLPWNEPLLLIKARIEPLAGVNFTGALLNLYRDGADSMGWHRDNEKELGINPVIASVSFGASRIFQFRDYLTKKEQISVDLTNGSLLIMSGETQHHWQHRIPKQPRTDLPRINITFRVI